jgi:hypothetical protein
MKKSNLRATAALQALAILGAGLTASMIVATPASAQDVTAGTLSGTVADAKGTPIPGAQVVVRSNAGVVRNATTSGNGSFLIPSLPVGSYEVRISATGHQTVTNSDVQVQLGGSNYNFEAPVVTAQSGAGSSEIVVIGRRVRAVDFSGTATGQVFNAQQVASQIPIPRSIEAIQLLAPQTTAGTAAFGGVSIGGSSVAENIYYINGMNVTNFRTGLGGTTVPFEFYDQIQVKTGGYQAEFGRNTGGAVIALTRSGSNAFHGGINFTYAPNSTRSTSPNTYSQDNNKDIRRNAEGNIWASGPIIKDRVFFFAFFNPRYAYQSDTAQLCDTGTLNNCVDTSTTTQISKTPFYGGKIDINLFAGHRLEGTYFSDDQSNAISQSGANSTAFAGGRNYIVKYTGSFTNWLTISALYGNSKFNQTTSGSSDNIPYVLDGRTGTLVYIAGSPSAVIESGSDSRKAYRFDADVNVNFLGAHRIRVGGDYEELKATDLSQYSGGIYNRFYRSGAGGALGGLVAPSTDYVRVRSYFSGGSFKSKNRAFYIQDSWDVTNRLNLSLGIRNDRFQNLNADGATFTDLKNQWAPRLGFNFDPTGEKRTRISGFVGRYFLPVAANTNIRLAGNNPFIETFYALPTGAGGVYSGNLINPTLGAQLRQNILNPPGVALASTLVSKNLKPQNLDEAIFGGEHRFANSRWSVSANLTYRKLGKVLEDVDFDGSGTYASIIDAYCRTQTQSFCNAGATPDIGSGGYVLMNPGSDLVVDVTGADNKLHELLIPAAFIGNPKAKRNYFAAEFKFERAFDGVWGVGGSYVWARSRGNYEGGVKSDNGQSDTGLTQDFDEPGWMDGSYGNLPNDRRHTFKIYGAYQITKAFRVGANVLVQSPRSFGCIGTYPYADGRAATDNAASWYCPAQVDAGTLTGTGVGNYLIGRGNAFKSDWNKRVDLSFAYAFPLQGLQNFTLRADVFNILNSKAKLGFNEIGDLDDPAVINPNYRRPTSYQAPRSVRFSASVTF